MHTIRKEFKFEAAHVLNASESKECQYIHGHSYRVEVFLSRMDLNANGMVEDFKVVKEAFKPIIDRLDHALIVKEMPLVSKEFGKISPGIGVVVLRKNPTAENMAEFIYKQARTDILSDEVTISAIRVHETDSGYAEFIPDLPCTLEEKTKDGSNAQNDLIKKIIQIIKEVESTKQSKSLENINIDPSQARGYIRIKRCVEDAINKLKL